MTLRKIALTLALGTAFTAGVLASTEVDSLETKIKAASAHVQEKADLEIAKKHDTWWKEYCEYVGLKGAPLTRDQQLLASQYFLKISDVNPEQVLWLRADGQGILVPLDLNDSDLKVFHNNIHKAMENIVAISVRDKRNYVGDHLKSRELSNAYLEDLNQQINDLMKDNKTRDDKILKLESKVDTLEKEVSDLKIANANFVLQLKTANERISTLEVAAAKSEKDAEKVQALFDQEKQHKESLRVANENISKVQKDLLDQEKKYKDIAAEKDRELANLRQSVTLEKERDKAVYEVEIYKKKYDKAKKKKGELSEEANKLKTELLVKQTTIEFLNKELEKYTVDLNKTVMQEKR